MLNIQWNNLILLTCAKHCFKLTYNVVGHIVGIYIFYASSDALNSIGVASFCCPISALSENPLSLALEPLFRFTCFIVEVRAAGQQFSLILLQINPQHSKVF